MSETDQEPKRSWSIKQIFLILDEASGISDKAINILTGALTEKDNRMLMMSQPTRPSGYFYDSHHKNAKSELKWFTEFGHLNRGDMLTSEQHRSHNEKKKFQRRV
ncbi:hypothetical protein ACQ5AX_004538 [Escherichia coli]|uniref:Uncharacterized protein n=1 Tax=Escherichia coli TaxID=562 RepID=A0A2P9E1U6_ECOLX|nr:hypothetical protein [Escherichia coli]MCV5867877.1 hypothetical protein [Escherichia coli]MED8618605.1 hypothetical protein [Escherichia coli]SPD97346.1 hypothetical protein RCS32TR557_P0066 [Escherichia coli]